MKKIILAIAILFAAGLNSGRAQDTWAQKANFGGTGRYGAAGFSINGKGYMGCGYDFNSGHKNDFWEYDPSTDAWTQKANFAGLARETPAGFAIGNKGYIGCGYHFGGSFKDFYKYDPLSNTWTQKADFGGSPTNYPVGLCIGSKGYIGTGGTDKGFTKDFWEYDPSANTWTRKADFGGEARALSTGFSINSKGYIGTGSNSSGTLFKDFWEYDPSTNTWTQKADFGGGLRTAAGGFSIGSNGYITMGGDASGNKSDLWQYDPSTDLWTQKANFPGTARAYFTTLTIGNKGYIGIGDIYPYDLKDFWEYNPDGVTCSSPTNLSVKNITSTSAKLKWDSVAGAKAYKIHYQVLNGGTWAQIRASTNSKTIIGLSPGTRYRWMVQTYCKVNVYSAWSAKDTFTTAALATNDASLQLRQTSLQIFPIPAKDHVTVEFTLAQSSHVYVKVHDVNGKEMTTLFNGNLAAGSHSVSVNTDRFSKGVYVVKMISDSGTENQKLVVE